MIKVSLLLLVFWMMQAVAATLFKYGSAGPDSNRRRWLFGFLSGNAVGMTSMWVCMLIYSAMPTNPNIATAMTGGGAFIIVQVALAVLFHSKLSCRQWGGIAFMALGLILAGQHGMSNL